MTDLFICKISLIPHERDAHGDRDGCNVPVRWTEPTIEIDNIPAELERMAEIHVKGFHSTGEEVRNQNPICQADDHAWPCDTFVALQHVERLNVEMRSAYEAGGF